MCPKCGSRAAFRCFLVFGVPIFYTGIYRVIVFSEHIGTASVTSQYIARRILPGETEFKLKTYYYWQYGWRVALVALAYPCS